MNLEQLTWTKSPYTKTWNGMKVHSSVADADFPAVEDAVGVDPGKNFGLSTVIEGELTAYWGTFPDCDRDQDYFKLARDFTLWLVDDKPVIYSLVEGPSYGSHFKQVMLEDVRLGFFIALEELELEPEYIPPQTARKKVFGHGRTKAMELWLDLDGNAAASAAIALCAGGYLYEEME